jgi:hypothetical protein
MAGSMLAIIIAIFALGYVAIVLEQPLTLNNSATALLTGVRCWAIYALTTSIVASCSWALHHNDALDWRPARPCAPDRGADHSVSGERDRSRPWIDPQSPYHASRDVSSPVRRS